MIHVNVWGERERKKKNFVCVRVCESVRVCVSACLCVCVCVYTCVCVMIYNTHINILAGARKKEEKKRGNAG